MVDDVEYVALSLRCMRVFSEQTTADEEDHTGRALGVFVRETVTEVAAYSTPYFWTALVRACRARLPGITDLDAVPAEIIAAVDYSGTLPSPAFTPGRDSNLHDQATLFKPESMRDVLFVALDRMTTAVETIQQPPIVMRAEHVPMLESVAVIATPDGLRHRVAAHTRLFGNRPSGKSGKKRATMQSATLLHDVVTMEDMDGIVYVSTIVAVPDSVLNALTLEHRDYIKGAMCEVPMDIDLEMLKDGYHTLGLRCLSLAWHMYAHDMAHKLAILHPIQQVVRAIATVCSLCILCLV
jgi:hypothetical protein